MPSLAQQPAMVWLATARMRWRRLAVIVLVALSAGFAAVPALPAAGLVALATRVPAPELSLRDVDGNAVNLAALRGKVVVVNFWATWCPPCRKELPSLARLQKLFKPDQVRVLAINIGEDEETVFGYLPAPEFTVLLDEKSRSLQTWQINGLPSTFVVDRNGRIALRAVGGREFDHPATMAQLRQLLQD
jgi:thiol-disulfide isomerase/thioredoxin